jgi:hypothetical protein
MPNAYTEDIPSAPSRFREAFTFEYGRPNVNKLKRFSPQARARHRRFIFGVKPLDTSRDWAAPPDPEQDIVFAWMDGTDPHSPIPPLDFNRTDRTAIRKSSNGDSPGPTSDGKVCSSKDKSSTKCTSGHLRRKVRGRPRRIN